MKIVGQILLACIVLTLLQYAVAAALVIAVLSLLWGIYFRTRETIAFVATLLIIGLISNHPVACIVVAGVAFVVIKLAEPSRDVGQADGDIQPPPPALPAPAPHPETPAGGNSEACDG